MLPDAPRLAVTPEGDPWLDFVWYRTSDPRVEPKPGGVLTLVAELAVRPEERAAILAAIPGAFGVPAAEVSLKSIDFKTGSVALTYAGEGAAGGEFINRLSGSGPAYLTGTERATFVVDLTADGAALLWQAIEKRLPAFHLRYDLVFDHRLTGVQMRVWADGKRCHSIATSMGQAAGADPARLQAAITDQRAGGVEIVTSAPVPADQLAALQKLGNDVLARALASALFAPPAPGGRAEDRPLRPYSASLEASLNLTLDESHPIEQHAVLDSIISPDFTPEQRGRRMRQTQLGSFFSILDVQVVCTVDFSLGLIAGVKASLWYEGEASGQKIQRTGEFVFEKGSLPVQRFRTDMASPEQNAYRYALDVFFRGDPVPWRVDRGERRGSILTIDLDEAGILTARVELRDVPFDVVSGAVVNLRHTTKPLAHTVMLNGSTMSATWRVVVRDAPKTWEHKTDWLLADGRRIEGAWVPAGGGTVRLDAPAELKAKAKVQLVATGDFSSIAQIAVVLRTRPDGANATEFSFTADGEGRLWEVTLAPGVVLEYEYRRTIFYRDGSVRQADTAWVASTRPVLAVSDDSMFEVKIVPRFLDLGKSLKLAIVDLESDASKPELQQKKTIVLRDKEEQARWTFRPEDPTRHKYRYRLAGVNAEGARNATEWRSTDAAVLVLQFRE